MLSLSTSRQTLGRIKLTTEGEKQDENEYYE